MHMHKQESVLENGKHKILRDFKIQTDYLIQVRKPDLALINKKRKLIVKLILPFKWITE